MIPPDAPPMPGQEPVTQPRSESRGRGVSVLVGVGIGTSATAMLTVVLLSTSDQLRPALAGIYSALAIGGLLLALLAWFMLQE